MIQLKPEEKAAKPKRKPKAVAKPTKPVAAPVEPKDVAGPDLIPLLIRLPADLVRWLDEERFSRKAATRTDLIRAILLAERARGLKP